MKSFDEAFEEHYSFCIDDPCKHRYENSKEFAKEIYREGQQSRQAEVDELQKRIDDALNVLSQMKHNGAYRAIDVLKGKN